jgi:hypothetical protein
MRRLSALFTSLPLRKNLPMTVTSFDRLCEGATVVMVIGPHLHVLARSLAFRCSKQRGTLTQWVKSVFRVSYANTFTFAEFDAGRIADFHNDPTMTRRRGR